jgi:hypothetical protein
VFQISDFRQSNEMTEVLHFINTWSSAHAVASPDEIQHRTSSFGNINSDGSAFGGYARTLTLLSPLFFALVEPTVRPLVKVCTEDLGLITYTSCEGHAYPDDRLNSQLHVGVLPRSAEEYGLVLQIFDAVFQRVNLGTSGAQFAIVKGEVIDRATDEKWPVIDLYLINLGLWPEYYESRVNNVSNLIGVLKGMAAEGDLR